MKILKSISLAALVILAVTNFLKAQSTKSLSSQYIEKLLTERKFMFTTYFIGETSDGKPILSPDYHLSIFNNRISAELPAGSASYRNLAFTSFATVVKFNSTNYYYKAEAINNTGWRVLIMPLNDQDIKGMILNINKKGDASLAIASRRYKTFTYNGTISNFNGDN